jgi:transcriptional antiterminator RfaH
MSKMTGILPGCQTDCAEPAWYCLQSQPKRERIATICLRLLQGVIVFFPRIKFKRPTLQGLVSVTEAMFPSYLFAHFELKELHHKVRYTHGVRGIVRFGDRYPTVEEHALERLRVLTGDAEIRELNHELSQGDQVKIVDGALVGLDAVITKVLPAKQRIRILMDFLGRKMEAEVELSNVLPQLLHPLAALGS